MQLTDGNGTVIKTYGQDNGTSYSDFTIDGWDSGRDIKLSKYDVLFMLKAYAYNKRQKWSGLKKKDLKNL